MVLEFKNIFLHSILYLLEIWKIKAICPISSRVHLGSKEYLRNASNCTYQNRVSLMLSNLPTAI